MYTINILYICICLIHICVCVCICAQAFIYILTICQFSLQQLFQVTNAHTNNFKYIFIYCVYAYSSLFVFCKRKLCFANIHTYLINCLRCVSFLIIAVVVALFHVPFKLDCSSLALLSFRFFCVNLRSFLLFL